MTKLTYQLSFAIAAIAAATAVWANQDCKGKCDGKATVATSTEVGSSCCKGKCEGKETVATSTAASDGCSKGKCDLAATVATSTEASGGCSKGTCDGKETVATSTAAESGCSKGKCDLAATVATSTEASGGCCKGKCEGTATVATSTAAKCEGCDETCKGCDGKCEDTATVATSTDASCEGCPITAAMEKLPKMTFAVGQEKTCCPETAKKLAKDSGQHLHFVVADKTYHDKTAAFAALVEETETFVTAFAKPKTCKVSGTTTVAGKAHSCSVAAGQTATLADEAMKTVHLTYVVGEKECHCPIEAKQTAEKTGEQTLYVVGKEKTGCNVTARLNLARAKYRAAVEALAKAEAAEKPEADKS